MTMTASAINIYAGIIRRLENAEMPRFIRRKRYRYPEQENLTQGKPMGKVFVAVQDKEK